MEWVEASREKKEGVCGPENVDRKKGQQEKEWGISGCLSREGKQHRKRIEEREREERGSRRRTISLVDSTHHASIDPHSRAFE